ncbi:MAG: alanine racemase [Lachnospiraceae bacterium]|nr:alanine racemase [Lachnospiraceae bacterium]
MNSEEYKRVCARISLDAIRSNYEGIKQIIRDNTKIMAVLKTDGYGHGAVPIARELEPDEKLYGFALATAEEALILRNSGIRKPLLVLGYTFPDAYEELILKDISFTVFREDMLKDLCEVVRNLSSTEYRYRAKVHIKIDTGMGRIGVKPDDSGLAFVKEVLSHEELFVEGVFTHFAKADEKERTATEKQLSLFTDFTDRIRDELHYEIPIRHASNSAGILAYPEANLDVVRAGIILYGLWPSDEVPKDRIALKPALSLYSRIIYLKEIEPGDAVSYGGTYVAKSPRRVATISIGYGEGYPRALSGTADVLIGGRRCRILGRICMDQLMADVTDVPGVAMGDRVTLIGTDGAETISMEELGSLSGRFNYEMACDLGKRIPRIFIRHNEVVYAKDYHQDLDLI